MQAAPTGSQPVHATARESAFYQAGYEAGAAHALQGKAAELGALALDLEAFTRTCVSLRTGLSQLHGAITDVSQRKTTRAWASQIFQAVDLAETLRSSIMTKQVQVTAKAKLANEDAQNATKTFAQHVARAQEFRRPPSLLQRLVRAVQGNQP